MRGILTKEFKKGKDPGRSGWHEVVRLRASGSEGVHGEKGPRVAVPILLSSVEAPRWGVGGVGLSKWE